MAAFITAAPPPRASAPMQLLRSHPLVAYFTIAFGGTWLLMLPIVLAQNGLGLLPFTLPDILLVVLFILGTFMGPTLAAFLVTAATSGRAGVRRLLQRYIQWRVSAGWYLVVFAGPIVMIVVGLSAWLGLAPLATAARQWLLIFSVYLPKALALSLFPALAEEPGWRGVALTRLQQRFGPVLGSSILGSLHALWHLPIFFIAAFATGPLTIGVFVTFILEGIAATIFYTWIFNNTGGSLLIMILLHATLDAQIDYGHALLPAFTYDDGITLCIFGACALLLIIFTRGRLSYTQNCAAAQRNVPLTSGPAGT
jgi:uncharacterized protein